MHQVADDVEALKLVNSITLQSLVYLFEKLFFLLIRLVLLMTAISLSHCCSFLHSHKQGKRIASQVSIMAE